MPSQQLSQSSATRGQVLFSGRASIGSLTLACAAPCPWWRHELCLASPCAGACSPGVECRRGRAALWTLVVGCPWWWLPWLRTVVALNWCSCSHLHLAPIGWPAARLAEARLWISVHGIEAWRPLDGLRRLALSRADLLLPVSRFTADRLRSQLGVQCPPLTLLPNTYDAERFSPGHPSVALLERYGLFPGQLVVFSLSRLSRGDHAKHLDRLITAMVKLRRSHPRLMLLIGGDGDDRARLLALVEDLGLQGSVLLPGRIADQELADHYRLASVFALPSEKEGFGIVFLEALGCGRPVLAGNRDGSVDPLADGRFGCLVDPRQPLAGPLAALLECRGEPLWFQPEELASAVAEQFGFGAFCRRLEQLLDDVPGKLRP